MYDLVIVGSGISSLSFLKGLKKRNRKIGLISYEKSKKISNKSISNEYIDKSNYPPRFKFNNHNLSSVYNYFNKNNLKVKKDASIFGMLSNGGVSNYWGCSSQFLDNTDIDFLNKKNRNNLSNSFQEIYKKYNFTGNYNLKNTSKINKRNTTQKILKEIIEKINSRFIKFYENCIASNYKNGLNFTPKNISKEVENKFIHLNYFVKKIKKNKNFYEIYCEKDNNKIIIKTKKLVLAAGTIATTKLVCEMLNYKKKIKINHNPMLFGCFFLKNSFKVKESNFLPSKLAAEIISNKNKFKATANFRGSNFMIRNKIFNNYFIMKNYFFQKIYKKLENKLLFINLYLDNHFSNLYFNFTNESASISTNFKNLKKIRDELNNNYNKIYKILNKQSVIFPLRYSFVPKMGTDNHFTGTIPISKNNKTLTVNEKCELKEHKNFFIIDGSVIPKTNLKFPTGLIISNAFRIGTLF